MIDEKKLIYWIKCHCTKTWNRRADDGLPGSD